jgi:cell wall-associated NlpC family hydrolase
MKFWKYLIIILCAVQITGCQNKEVPSDLQAQLDSISSAMVPQHAEALCDISLVMNKGKNITVKGETNLPEAKDKVIELLNRSGYTFNDSITVLPDTSVVKKPWGLVTVSVCNIRSRPAHAAEQTTQALMGTPVRILNKRGGWHLVQMPDSYIGWVRNTVVELTDDEMFAWKRSDRLIYLGHTGVITDSRGETVSDVSFGAILVKNGTSGDKWTVVLPDGRTGEVKKSEAAELRTWAESVDIEPQRLIRFARSFMGTPYLWGGTSTKGVDCSGYTKMIYYYGGVIMTRDASAQFRYGDEVSIEKPWVSLAPGDLLYFGSVRDGKKNITHTGMYIGDTEFIHATAGPGMVIINSFDSTRTNYSANLLEILQGARRVTTFTEGKGLERVSHHTWYF